MKRLIVAAVMAAAAFTAQAEQTSKKALGSPELSLVYWSQSLALSLLSG